MEIQLTILLYSKYSAVSKKLMDFINLSGMDFTTIVKLQLLCIDNDKIRQKIMKNQKIEIVSVPCILVIYTDGGLEKYDGNSAFDWAEDILQKERNEKKINPTQQKWTEQQQILINRENLLQEKEKQLIEKEKSLSLNLNLNLNKQKPRKPIKKAQTQLEDLISEEEVEEEEEEEEEEEDNSKQKNSEEENDRYKDKKQPKSIRLNSGNYTQNDDLFQGEIPDNRGHKKSAIKIKINEKVSSKKSQDIMSKAKEMAKNREADTPHPPTVN
jgi:hypothetical protein